MPRIQLLKWDFLYLISNICIKMKLCYKQIYTVSLDPSSLVIYIMIVPAISLLRQKHSFLLCLYNSKHIYVLRVQTHDIDSINKTKNDFYELFSIYTFKAILFLWASLYMCEKKGGREGGLGSFFISHINFQLPNR